MLQKVIKRFPPFLSPGLRPFAVFFLCTALFLGAQEAWGADYWEYTWTGIKDTNWLDKENWYAVEPGTTNIQNHASPPNAHGDTAIIPAGRANYPIIKSTGSFDLFLNAGTKHSPGPGSITIESGGTVTIENGASVTCGKVEIQQGGTLINNGKLKSTTYHRSVSPAARNGEAHIQNDGTFKNSGTVTVERISTEPAGSSVLKGMVTGDGRFELGGTITTGAEQTYAGAVTLADNTTLEAKTNGDITFKGTLDGAFSLTVSQAKDVTFTGAIGGSVPLKNIVVTAAVSSITAEDVTLTGSWENKSNTVGTVGNMIFTGVDTSQIFGNNVFDNFTCTTPGKMLSFENDRKQTVSNTFTIIGTAGTGLIQLTGFSFGTYWEIEAGTHLVKYAKVDSSHNVKASTIMTCYNGIVTSSSEWNTMSLSTYYWNGNNNSWSTPGNWRLGNASGVSAQYAPQSFDDVEIPNSLLTYPNLEADVTIASLTLADGASINGAKNLTVNGNTAIVGKIGDTTPLASFTVGGKTTIGTNGGSLVSINTTGNQTYRNDIEIKALTTFTAQQDITVSGAVTMQTGNLTINAVGAVIFNRDITGTTTTITLEKAASAVFNGRLSLATFTNQASATIVFNNSVRVTNTFTSNNADSVTSHLSFYAKIFSGSGTNTSYTFKGTTISNVFSISSTGTVTLAGILQIDGTPVASPGFTFPGPVVLASRTEINSKNGTIRFSSTINGAQGSSYALTLNAGTGDVIFTGDVGGTVPLADITINTANTAASINAGNVALTGSWNNKSGANANVKKIEFTGTGTSQIEGTNTFTTLASSKENKIIEFPSSGTTVNTFSFNASAGNEITLRGIADAAWAFNYSGSRATLTNIKVRKSSFTNTSVLPDVILSVSSTAAVQSANNTASNQKTGSPRWNFGNEYIWTGAAGGDWNNNNNWSMGVIPPADSDVVIQANTTNNLNLETNTATLASLTINDGATFNIQTGNILDAQKTVFGDGVKITGDGTLSTTIPDPITGSVTINAKLTITGTVTINAPGKNVVLNNSANVFNGVVTVEQTKDISLTGTFTGGLEQKNGTGTTTLGQITLNSNGISIINNKLQITDLIQDAGFFFAQATDTTAPTIELGANVSATTSISFAGSVVLTNNLTLTAGSGGIIFNNVINSASTGTRALTVTTGHTTGDITFGDTIGVGTPLATLTAIGTGKININGGSVTTTGAQSYDGAVTIGATPISTLTTTLTTTNSDVTFNNAVNLNQNLKIDTGTDIGDIIFFETNATINGTHNLEFLAGTGDITFNGAVGSESAPIGKFTVTSAGKVSINNAFFQTKTTTDDFIVTSGNIAVGANTFIAGNIKLDSGTFTQTGNNVANTHSVGNITLATGTTMEWAVGTIEKTGGTLTITGGTITAVDANSIDFGFKNVTFGTNITLNKLILYDLTIPSNVTVTLNGPITVRRNITIEDGGSYFPGTHALTLGGTGTVDGTIRDENDGTSNPKQNFGVIEIEQRNTTKTFATDITAGTITCNAGSGAVTFEEKLTAIQLTNSGGIFKLFFNGGLNISDPDPTTINTTTINTTGLVTFGKTNHFEEGLHIVNAEVNLGLPSDPDFSLTTTSNDIIFEKAVTLSNVSKITILTGNGAITFTETIDGIDPGTSKLFLKAEMGAVTFTGAVGATKPLESVNVHGNEIEINGGTVTTKGSQIYTGAVTIGEDTTLSTTDNNISFNSTVIGTTANRETLTLSAGTGNVIFGGAVGTQTIPLGSVTIQSASTALTGGVQIASDMHASDFVITTHSASNSNVYITGAAAFNIGSTVVTEINFPANLFIAAGGSNAVSFNKDVTVTENLVLFSGQLNFPQTTTIEKDLVLLNGTDPDMYGTGNVYTYNGPQRKGKEASLTAFPQQVPSNTTADNAKIQSPYSGEVDSLDGNTITVKQNFYTNGVNLPATANWSLNLKGNQNTTVAFAEAYEANVEYSQVASIDTSYAWVAAAEATDGGNNTEASSLQSGWAFNSNIAAVKENDAALPIGIDLSGTYTVYDDVIRLEFFYTGTSNPAYIQNDSGQIWDAATTLLQYNTGTTAVPAYKNFSGAYTTADCSTKTTAQGNLSVFYVRTQADDRWNTDATGTAPGDSNSTDRGRPGTAPAHRSTLPSITFTENNLLKDIFKNRIKTETNFNTADRCRPVVVEVRTGQEVHKPFASQAKYDAHNFIEIRYSEPVTIPQFSDPDLTEYVKSQNTASSAAAGGAIKQNGTGLDISGFANLETGTLETGTNGVNDPTVHALYRNFTFDGTESVNPADSAQPHRVRISIAGWTDTKGATGYEYPGYIDNAVTPSGAVTVEANRNIKDLSAAFTDGNPLEPTNDTDTADNTGYGLNRDTNHPKAAITVNKADSVLYGSWDIAPPVVSRFDWYDEKNGYEIVGNSNAAGYVGNFEFHFFDNTPDYPKTPPGGTTWLYSRGWGDLSNPIRPDTVGGSRPEYVKTPTSPKTQGGLRAATITADIVKNAFLLYLAEQKSNIGFDGTFERFITLNNFFGDETQPLSVTDDTLYLSLKPARTDLRSRETYDVAYDSSKGFITDLAGNRLKSAIWRTIDRTPPKISMTVTPYDDTRLFVFFNKKIELDPLPAAQNAVLSNIHQEFLFFNKFIDPALDPDASLAISDLHATKAELVFHTEDATGLILTLSRKVSYTELSTAFISLKKHDNLEDITGPVPAASNITDKKYNWMNWNDRIPITYFGVNTIKPLYATDGMVQTGGDKKEGTTVVIRGDFDGSGQLYYDREISMQVRLADGVMPQTVPDVFIDAKPNPDSVSVTFNKNSGKNLSFWLPNLPDFPYQLISPSMNTHAVKLATGTGSGQVYTFKIPVNSPEREPGDTLQFIFRHGEIMTPDRITGQLIVPTPFYHIRLNNAQDPSELSLFAFNVLSMLRQRGGSTILNNVIQAGSEEAVLEVIMPKQGNLTVSVMTLDGNVIKHLHHGTASAGTHYLRWNGTNASGRAVARGMYFVRIIGPNIDETRKIMVVKD